MESKERIEYLESEYKKYYVSLRESSSHLFERLYDTSDNFNDYDTNYSTYWTHEILQRMFNILCVYFETLGLVEFLKAFKDEFGEIIKSKEKSTEIISIPLDSNDSEEDLKLLIEWKKFLAPFSFFWDSEFEKTERTKKILHILESTNDILKLTKTQVYKEEDINSVIRDISSFYFKGVIPFSDGFFSHKFKQYRPDLIIQEINVAIEYKLIREVKEISTKFDELLVDANRYVGNSSNKICIAVFCLSETIPKSKRDIREDWDNMKFPSNWILIIIKDIKIFKKGENNDH